MGETYKMAEIRLDGDEIQTKMAGRLAKAVTGLQDASRNMQLDLGRSLLTEARNGNAEKVKELVGLGAPFTADWLGISPIHYSVSHNNIEVTELLLRSGIAQDARNKVDRTPLHIACQMGHKEVVKLLFAFNADPAAKDMLRMTPLHWAVENGNPEIVRMVLHHGCPIDILDKFGKTATDLAEDKADYGLVKLIQDMKDLSEPLRASLVSSTKRQSQQLGSAIRREDSHKADDIMKLLEKRKKVGVSMDKIIPEPWPNGFRKVLFNTNTFIKMEPQSPPPSNGVDGSARLLEEHGISMMEPDTDTVVNSAVSGGHTLRLTDAGKLALISSQPPAKIVHVPKPKTIIEVTKPFVNNPKPIGDNPSANDDSVNGVKKEPVKLNKSPLNVNGKKIIQVKADELIKMATQKKFVIKASSSLSSNLPSAKLLDGKLYTNIDQYIERIKIKRQECQQNITELERLLFTKKNEIARLNLMLERAFKEKFEKK